VSAVPAQESFRLPEARTGCTAAQWVDLVTAWAATLAAHPEGTRATAAYRVRRRGDLAATAGALAFRAVLLASHRHLTVLKRVVLDRISTHTRRLQAVAHKVLCKPVSTAAARMGACVAMATAVARNAAAAMVVVARAAVPEVAALVALARLAVAQLPIAVPSVALHRVAAFATQFQDCSTAAPAFHGPGLPRPMQMGPWVPDWPPPRLRSSVPKACR
jgi:hypothetical protein